jgi:hypothetical protein
MKGGTSMDEAKAVTFVALLALMTLTLVSTLVAFWFQLGPKEDLFKLSQLLFSWQVVGGGLTMVGFSTHKDSIKDVLNRIAGTKLA